MCSSVWVAAVFNSIKWCYTGDTGQGTGETGQGRRGRGHGPRDTGPGTRDSEQATSIYFHDYEKKHYLAQILLCWQKQRTMPHYPACLSLVSTEKLHILINISYIHYFALHAMLFCCCISRIFIPYVFSEIACKCLPYFLSSESDWLYFI